MQMMMMMLMMMMMMMMMMMLLSLDVFFQIMHVAVYSLSLRIAAVH